MSNSDISFDRLNTFIEKTEKLLNDLSFRDSNEITELTKSYLDEYENKSKIVFGITSAFSYSELLNHKLRSLKTLKNECGRMSNNVFIPEVIESDLDYSLFTKKSILDNRVKKILDFVINEIELLVKHLKNKSIINQEIEILYLDKHTEIFSNNGFELFDYILKNHISEKGKSGRYADISYYYWRMHTNNPIYIHQRPEVFRNWFCQEYDDNFEKIKTLNDVTDKKGNRATHYSNSLEWFKLKNHI
ncbi:MAG: hypothetical protein QM535_04315 [Limnohabitans sp.]|nr:hypothetical protein [Limnohabitans sp.]